MEEEIITTEKLSNKFLSRVKKDKDVALGISGYEGDGKSVLACQIVIDVLRQLGHDDEYILENFNEYMIYAPNKDEMFKKITRPEKYAPINSDEATKALYKLNWASNSQKFLNMLFQLCRKENKINILCIPRFSDLNEYFRNHRIMFWVHILETGTACLMIRDWSPFSKDPWHLDENKKIIDIARKKRQVGDFTLEEKIALMKKTRGFVGIVKWDDLTTKFKNVYRKGKEHFGYDGLDIATEDGMVGKKAEELSALRRKLFAKFTEEGKSTKEIAELLNISVRYAQQIHTEVVTYGTTN